MNAVASTTEPIRVYTIGHSTRTLDELVAALESFAVTELVDVRTVPRSRHTPQFDATALSTALPVRGIGYRHLPALGGLRHAARDSINTGWRNASFRGYADHMQTPAFDTGIDRLIDVAAHATTAIMCAEAVPWRCHRSMIGDALLVRGIEVLDIFGPDDARSETLTGFARVSGTRITYPDPNALEIE